MVTDSAALINYLLTHKAWELCQVELIGGFFRSSIVDCRIAIKIENCSINLAVWRDIHWSSLAFSLLRKYFSRYCITAMRAISRIWLYAWRVLSTTYIFGDTCMSLVILQVECHGDPQSRQSGSFAFHSHEKAPKFEEMLWFFPLLQDNLDDLFRTSSLKMPLCDTN